MAPSRREFLRTSASIGIAALAPANQNRQLLAQTNGQKLAIGPNERIVFLGDSITQGGSYVAYLETLIRLRHPKAHIEIHNHGISSETISGTSEPDHNPRRPWAHERFTRDVADWKPSIVFSCFGMNDGNYHPFDQERFEKYQAGIHRLIERLHTEANCNRLVISTPPPFDAYQRKNGDPEATSYGYRYPAIDYDQTLHRYADWLLGLRQKGHQIVDLHTRLNHHLKARRQGKVSFTMMPDAVHPNATGHAMMAVILAEGLGLNGPRDSLVLDAHLESAKARHGKAEIKQSGPETVIHWHAPAAWCFGKDVDPESLMLELVESRFNRLQLKLSEPAEGGYRLVIPQGKSSPDVVRELTSKELAEGVLIDAPAHADAQDRVQGEALATAIMQHRQAASAAWRSRAMKLERNDPERGPRPAELEAEARAAERLTAEAAKLAGPIEIRLVKTT